MKNKPYNGEMREVPDVPKALYMLRLIGGFTSIKSFCSFLGITQRTFDNWCATNCYNYTLLKLKFPQVNDKFLYTGTGELQEPDGLKLKGVENEVRRVETKIDNLKADVEELKKIVSDLCLLNTSLLSRIDGLLQMQNKPPTAPFKITRKKDK